MRRHPMNTERRQRFLRSYLAGNTEQPHGEHHTMQSDMHIRLMLENGTVVSATEMKTVLDGDSDSSVQ